MRSFNKVLLIGNLGADPEIRSTVGGNKVATFSVATTRTWTDSEDKKQEKTEWHRCVVWNQGEGKQADLAEQLLKKGVAVHIEGRIEYRSWQDKEGQTKYATEINVQNFIVLSPKKD